MGELAQEADRSRVRPVQVVEHDDDRPVARGRLEEPDDRSGETVPIRVRRRRYCGPQSRHSSAEQRHHGTEIAAMVRGVLGQQASSRAGDQLIERLRERAVRNERLLVAMSVEHRSPTLGRLRRELCGERGLPGAGLARDQHRSVAA